MEHDGGWDVGRKKGIVIARGLFFGLLGHPGSRLMELRRRLRVGVYDVQPPDAVSLVNMYER